MERDNWRGRRKFMVCERCIHFVPKAMSVGRCRRHAPRVMEGWPVVFTSDWCGDFKLDELCVDPKFGGRANGKT